MTLFQAVLLSVVEGITEFLPVSSTGHLILTGTLLGIPQTDFVSSFEIFIQLGAILAIFVLFGKSVLKNTQTLKKVLYAFFPTAIIGFLLYKFIKHFLLNNPWVVVISLFVGGIALIGVELFLKKSTRAENNLEALSPKDAVAIGIAQSVSVVPGVSRAAATIIGGQLLHLSRDAAVQFSFLLAAPTMLAATGLDLVKSNFTGFSPDEFMLLGVGFIVSFLTAFVVVKLFLRYIQHHSFIPFGVYRIILAVVYTFTVLK